jgi:hypothetical protein
VTPALFSFNSRGAFPDDSHEQYGARLTGWITPTVTGDYNFYIRSDDASQLWISADATEANLQLVADEIGYGKPFQEPGAAQTTFTPLGSGASVSAEHQVPGTAAVSQAARIVTRIGWSPVRRRPRNLFMS